MAKSKEERKQAAKQLLERCKEEGVKLPTDPMNAMVQAGTMLNATIEDGEFQIENALKEMIEKFGQEEKKVKEITRKRKSPGVKKEDTEVEPTKSQGGKKATKKAAKDEDEEEASDNEEPKVKKPKKERAKPVATCEKNQALADAFAELSAFEFKRGEKFKGGTWAKVAKAIRDATEPIDEGKQALKLKGVGKSSAKMIDEFHESGTFAKLEEFRAGNL